MFLLPVWATAGSSASFIPFLLVVALTLLIATLLLSSLFVGGGVGNKASTAQAAFSLWVRLGRLRNLLCSSCDRASARYPVANTCQVPFFRGLSDVYTFVFGYKKAGMFVEVGAYDGESFSNTSGLADMGWEGHYLEPIPQYAAAAAARHAGNAPRVRVHTVAVGERDGEVLQLSTAGPFTSASKDEISAVAASGLHKTLSAFGWDHGGGVVTATTVSLNSFFTQQGLRPGAVDVMVRRPRAPFTVCNFLSLSSPRVQHTHTHTHTQTHKRASPLPAGCRRGGLRGAHPPRL
jgi:hypothetical protein